MKQHKHAEAIKAWADGADIEMYVPKDASWNYIKNPSWFPCIQYRVKPEPNPDVVKYFMYEFNAIDGSHFIQVFYEGVDRFDLKVIWDGETGKLKKAEVL